MADVIRGERRAIHAAIASPAALARFLRARHECPPSDPVTLAHRDGTPRLLVRSAP
jgi:hypothetical protein